jgi:hypothetical protein
LKRHKFGAGDRQIKWIYIAGYAGRRWRVPGPHRIAVEKK